MSGDSSSTEEFNPDRYPPMENLHLKEKIVLDLDSILPRSGSVDVIKLKHELAAALQDQLGREVVPCGHGATTKFVFSVPDEGEVLIIAGSFTRGGRENLMMIQNQTAFYEKYGGLPIFPAVVAPQTREIYARGSVADEMKKEVSELCRSHGWETASTNGGPDLLLIGMGQREVPFSLRQYDQRREKGFTGARKLRDRISAFVDAYRFLLNQTGLPHGDLFGVGAALAEENIRVFPDGRMVFIDYQGRRPFIIYNGEQYSHCPTPQSPQQGESEARYQEALQRIRQEDPKRLKASLENFFYHQAMGAVSVR